MHQWLGKKQPILSSSYNIMCFFSIYNLLLILINVINAYYIITNSNYKKNVYFMYYYCKKHHKLNYSAIFL